MAYRVKLPGVLREPNGLVAVEQTPVNGWAISFNPDDDRFYVHNADGSTAATFTALRNARQYARGHTLNARPYTRR
jgi:glutamate/tyrosine decarboxylase-like PLP-dependent enzyme